VIYDDTVVLGVWAGIVMLLGVLVALVAYGWYVRR
jgi:hypothetical protein